MTTDTTTTDTGAQAASTEQLHAVLARLEAEQDLKQTQAKLDHLRRARAELEAQIGTKQGDAATLADPDALDVAQVETAHLQLRVRGVARAAQVAQLEVNVAQLGLAEADEYARALGVPAMPNAN